MPFKVTFDPPKTNQIIDADGFYVVGGNLTLYQEAPGDDLGIEPELLHLFDVHPRRTVPVAAFPKGEWTSIYEIADTTTEQ